MEKITEEVLFHLFKMTGLNLNEKEVREHTDLGKGLNLYVFLFMCHQSIMHCMAFIVWENKKGTLSHKVVLDTEEIPEIFFQSRSWKENNLILTLAAKEIILREKEFSI